MSDRATWSRGARVLVRVVGVLGLLAVPASLVVVFAFLSTPLS